MNEVNFKEQCEMLVNSAIEFRAKEFINKGTLELDYTISDKMEMGGYSRIEDGKYTFVINYGVFKKLFDIFNVLLYKENEIFYRMVSLEEEYDPQKAQLYFDLLLEVASKVIIFHELGHVLNGHLAYINKELDSKHMNLFMKSDKNSIHPMLSRTLEMNADAFAATSVLAQLTYQKNINRYNELSDQLIKDKSHAYVLFFIATDILFSLMGTGKNRAETDIQLAKYLPLRTRLDCLVENSLAAYYNLNPERIQDSNYLNIQFFREVAPNIEAFVNHYFRDVEGIPEEQYSTKNNGGEISEEYLRHSELVRRYWSSDIVDKMEKYSYFTLPQ
ncbi:hypothetical protein LCM20_12170 [Halobacillus litoralis]|uniref:hypothetical protein n=1 Tax=Halobacillus litoralis TaxID=45668 RepID=UPI001CD3B6C3|nr:hypothetical protein [Halobacillus litoralis]MCA0971353.1 hypothetical protein [Halobacillus litoralis]